MPLTGPHRVVVVTTLLVVLASAAVVWVSLRDPAPPRTTSATRAASATPAASVGPGARDVGVVRAVGSLAVLRDWDRARAAAWAEGDAAALRALYLPGSGAGRRDVAMLRRWLDRGLRVEGMATQVLAVELRQRTDDRLVLVVTDRLADARAVGPAGATALPQDRPTTRRLVLRKVDGRWLMGAVTPVG